jgi:hypothetical protein
MEDRTIQMLKLAGRGYTCSQIMILMGLELRGETNPGLVRAMAGLAYGCGTGQASCGVLTGGSCLLALFAGKGSDDETGSEKLTAMLQDFLGWFGERIGDPSGALACEALVGQEGPTASRQRCGELLIDTFAKVLEILQTYEFDLSGS